MKKPYRSHLIVIGLYTALSLIFTWPLVINLNTHIPGEATWAFDESTFIWNMWWLKYSVLTLGQMPLYTEFTFFPLGINLTTYTFNLFNAAFGLPLQLALSLPLANNLTLLFSYISSGYGTYLLVRYLLASSTDNTPKLTHQAAAMLAGTVFAFSASRMMYVALGHYNFVTIQWFPFYALFLLKTIRQPKFKTIFLTSLFAALCLYAELTFSVFLLFLTIILLLGERPWRKSGRLIGSLVSIGVITFILTAPFILAVLPDFLDPAYAEPGWGEGLKLSADLVGLVTVTPLHPLSGLDWQTELRDVITGNSRFSDANTLFLGYGILALALLGFFLRRREGRAWLWAVIVFTILSLGPLLTINGRNRFDLDGIDATFPLPFALLHYIPVINANRVPNRFGIPLTLALAVLVGYATFWVIKTYSNRVSKVGIASTTILSLVLLVVLTFDQYSAPISLTDARIPDVYYQIGAEPDDFTIMQLPLGWRNSYGTLGSERTQLQYFQAAHTRPMLGGNTSRNPAFKFDYYRNIPLFEAITLAELYQTADEPTLEQARAQAAELMALYNIKYLVIHDPIPNRLPYLDTAFATQMTALDLIPHQPEPVYASPRVKAYAVEQAPIPDELTLDFGEASTRAYRGEGWAGEEVVFSATANWITANEALVFFPVRGAGDRQISLQIAPFSYPGSPQQVVQFSINGQRLSERFDLQENWQTIEITLPEQQLQQGLNRLKLHLEHAAAPRQVLPANRAIGTTDIETPVDLEVNSGVDFNFMTVGFDQDASDASAHRRGINIAIINPTNGQVIDQRGFDTAANEFEAAALVEYVQGIASGQIIILGSQGADATTYFSPDTWTALQSLGLTTEGLTVPFSAIGLKGASPGQALQAVGTPETSAYLRLGAVPDNRTLAAAVDFITIRVANK